LTRRTVHEAAASAWIAYARGVRRSLAGVALAAAAAALLVFCGGDPEGAPAVPRLPLGAQAYEAWERWPVLRVGMRTLLRSTHDRDGGNHASDASHFLREDGGRFVALDVEGTGVLSFVRTNHWHGSPWRYTVDGRAQTVSESSTADPTRPVEGSVFLPPELFPPPLAVTWSATRGADLSWVPIPFERSLELAYERTHYGTGYYIVTTVPYGTTDTTTPIKGWDAVTPPPASVRALFDRAGTDLAPREGAVRTGGTLEVAGGGATTLVTEVRGPGTVRALRFVVPRASAVAFGRARLRVTWDGRPEPSVDAPVALFFGAGTLYNRDDREWLVKALPVSVRFPPGAATVELAAYFPMPFDARARIELVASEPVAGVAWELAVATSRPEGPYGNLHATYRDHASPVRGEDLALLDTQGVEGADAWCGSVVGTSIVFSDRAVLGTLEGDPRFFFDDNGSPQVQGTGTEEWGGGGDYWGGQTMTLPFAGHPVGAPDPASIRDPEDGIESLYRFLLGDLMPFGRRARLQLEHGGENESVEHYRSVAYWYGRPEACLALADELDVGDPASERAHAYVAIGATEPEVVSSQYDLGPDPPPPAPPLPTVTDSGRRVRTSSEFVLALPADNAGALLRRTLDYAHPDQRAQVFVADADEPDAPFALAGVWYTAGSVRSVFSNPPGEADPATPSVRTSTRRWRDDELLIDRHLTEGRTRLRVRVVVAPAAHALVSTEPPGDGAWTEFKYRAFAWRVPRSH
jgi:hypothetical protein